METVLNFLADNATIFLSLAALVLSGLAVLAKKTSTTIDDEVVAALKKLVDDKLEPKVNTTKE